MAQMYSSLRSLSTQGIAVTCEIEARRLDKEAARVRTPSAPLVLRCTMRKEVVKE
jgi:hypothetical protein